MPLHSTHTAEDLREAFTDILQRWQLNDQKMSALTTDNASNNKKAFSGCYSWSWVPCFGHNLDLAVRKALAVEQSSDALVRLRSLVSGFNRSTTRKRELLAKQTERGLPKHQPIHDEPTRWGSTFDMVERFLEQQSAMCAVLAEDRKGWQLLPRDTDITVYETVRDVLAPIRDFTDAVSGEKKVTISCVIPVLWKIFSVLAISDKDTALAEQMKQVLADDLKMRYDNPKMKMVLECATFLDIRFKDTFVDSPDDIKKKIMQEIELMKEDAESCLIVKDDKPESVSSEHASSQADIYDEPVAKKKKSGSDLKDLLASIRTERKKMSTSTNSTGEGTSLPPPMSKAQRLHNEMRLYDTVQECDIETDPLVWWKRNEDTFPLLSICARKYLCIAATSVPSERVFSVSGGIVNPKRNRMTSDNVDMMTFLAKNLEQAETLI